MSASWKLILTIFACVVVGYIVVKWVIGTTMWLLSAALPILVVGGVAYVLYHAVIRKSLPGGRKTLP